MCDLLRFSTLIMTIMVVFMSSCDDGMHVFPTSLTGSTPANGNEIAVNGTLTLTFDNTLKSVTVNGTPSIVAGHSAVWNAKGLIPGQTVNLVVEWTNWGGSTGSDTITLSVIENEE
ncbi:hypothetical protein IH992_28105 [Candidatus Poribacteria bacterium]|nr:hypothetical protein [Candidatus Poribacteria bacterium]